MREDIFKNNLSDSDFSNTLSWKQLPPTSSDIDKILDVAIFPRLSGEDAKELVGSVSGQFDLTPTQRRAEMLRDYAFVPLQDFVTPFESLGYDIKSVVLNDPLELCGMIHDQMRARDKSEKPPVLIAEVYFQGQVGVLAPVDWLKASGFKVGGLRQQRDGVGI